MNLPELIVETAEAYEALAIRLASNPDEIRAVRSRLTSYREDSPLFDSKRFARSLEDGFDQAFARYADGLAPGDIVTA